MKPKTKAFADKLLENPKISQTDAYLETHKTENRITAGNNAHQLLKQPNVRIYMKRHEDLAKVKVVDLLESDKPDIVLKAATDILDRNLGKAVQRQQTQNTNLNLNIEASKELADNFAEFLKTQTSSSKPV